MATQSKTTTPKTQKAAKPTEPLNIDLSATREASAPLQKKSKNPEEKPYILPMTGYVRLKQLLQIVPFSASTVWRKSKSGDFPAAVKLSDKVTAFKVEDIRAWLESKESA